MIPQTQTNYASLNYCYVYRDAGNNHLVGTIRELIRIEGCFPSLRNL
jgi:hypothetical protein